MNNRISNYRNMLLGDHYRYMTSNLKKYIQLSGMSHAEVAAAKGIAPESLSRHISGRSQFSIQDAIDYAEILQIDPTAILFDPCRVKVYGNIINGFSVNMVNSSEKEKYVYTSNIRFASHVGAFTNQRSEFNTYFDGAITWADMRPIQLETIPQDALSRCCIYKCAKTKTITQAVLHKQQSGKFTIEPLEHGHSIMTDVDVVWACPVLGRAERPDLLGLEIK
tara:strand:+ start:677 stop:1342 length:666 start_codon:yes stop_codon:yes gene_type:complete